jgi:DNA polymerase
VCNYVFYRGQAPCDVLFIGEAPGYDEDMCGIPFVGRPGAMLDSWIKLIKEEGIKFTYGITNIVACIPKHINNDTGKKTVRPPTKEEADSCKLRLLTTISKASPSLIVVVGKTAKKYLRIPARGMEKEYNTPVLELQHPTYIFGKGGKNSLEYKRNFLYLKEAIENLNGS